MTKTEMLNALFNVYCKHRKSWLEWENVLDKTDALSDETLADRIALREFHKVSAIEEVANELFPHTDLFGMWLDTLD